jgi:hypothetical protein
MRRHPGFETLHQRRVHERVIVGNVETDDPFAFEMAGKVFAQAAVMLPLHDNDQIRPLQLLGLEQVIGIGRKTRAICLDAWLRRKNLRSCWAAQAISGANE